jgi:hypothetical protein
VRSVMSPVELEIISLSGSSKGLASTTATSAGNDDDASGSHTAGGSSNINPSSSTSVAGANESVYEELLNNRVGASRSLHLNNNMLACAATDAITSVVEAEFVAAATLESVIVSLVVDMLHFITLVICWLLFVVVFRMPRKSPYYWRQTSRRCKQNCDPCKNDSLLARRGAASEY